MKKISFDLNEHVNTSLSRSRNAPPSYVPKRGIKPSELGSPCLRKNYYVYHKVPSSFPWEVKNILAAEAGDAFHQLTRKQLRDSGILIENLDPKTGQIPISFIDGKTPDPEFPLSAPELGIRYAKADGMIDIPEGYAQSGLWILEIKSKAHEKFKFVRGPERDSYQGTLYAFVIEEALRAGKYDHIPGLQGKKDIQGTCYIYVNRDSNERKVFWERKDPKTMEAVIEKCLLILKYVEDSELPPKTQDFCSWCSWRDKCAIEYKVEKSE